VSTIRAQWRLSPQFAARPAPDHGTGRIFTGRRVHPLHAVHMIPK
jgi:hypothetical protein